jgi:hypothetical protein
LGRQKRLRRLTRRWFAWQLARREKEGVQLTVVGQAIDKVVVCLAVSREGGREFVQTTVVVWAIDWATDNAVGMVIGLAAIDNVVDKAVDRERVKER